MAFKPADLKSDAAISRGISSLVKRNANLRTDLHILLNAIAARWIETGDVRTPVKLVNELLAADLKGLHTNAFKAWIEEFFGFIYVTEGEQKDTFVSGKLKAADLRVQDMRNTRWYEFKPEPAYQPVDPAKALAQMIRRFENDRKKAGDATQVTPEMIEALKALKFEPAQAQ